MCNKKYESRLMQGYEIGLKGVFYVIGLLLELLKLFFWVVKKSAVGLTVYCIGVR